MDTTQAIFRGCKNTTRLTCFASSTAAAACAAPPILSLHATTFYKCKCENNVICILHNITANSYVPTAKFVVQRLDKKIAATAPHDNFPALARILPPENGSFLYPCGPSMLSVYRVERSSWSRQQNNDVNAIDFFFCLPPSSTARSFATFPDDF